MQARSSHEQYCSFESTQHSKSLSSFGSNINVMNNAASKMASLEHKLSPIRRDPVGCDEKNTSSPDHLMCSALN